MNGRQLNTLLVDDNEQNYITTRNLLAEIDGWQFNLEWVSTYEAAIEKMKCQQHDVCFFNYRLGERNGLELLHQVVENDLIPPLILLAEPEDHHIAAQAIAIGAVDYLIKGQINASLLERSIRYAVRYKQIEALLLEMRLKERTAELIAINQQLQHQITEYKQRERVLQESRELYQKLFDVDLYGVEVLDEQGNIIDCNTTFQRLLGYEREEIIGQHTLAFVSSKSKKLFQEKLALLEERGYVDGEVELVREDGSTVLVWRRCRVIYDETGVLTGSVTYSRDITERMKAVRQISNLARALEQSPIAIMVTDMAGNIEYVNFEFTELTGYTYEELVGQNLRTVKAGQLSSEAYEVLWNTITAGDEWQGEIHTQKKDGEIYWEWVTITPMFNAQGALTHFIVVQEDITTRKQTETEVIRSQRRIGDLVTEHISNLTTTNEALQHEITERKRAEKALRRSRARLKAQYKGIPIPTYSWQWAREDFVLVDYNNTAKKATQGRIADFLGKAASEIFKDRPQVLADFSRCVSEKTIVRREAPYRLVTTGENRYFVTTYNFVPPNLVIVHIDDITEQRQLEAEVRQCRNQLERLATEHTAELAKVKELLQDEATQRKQVEQALHQTEGELNRHQDHFEDLVKKRTAELTKANKQLQQTLARHEQAEESMSEARARLRAQYKGIPLPTYSWQRAGKDFVLVDYNDAAEKASQGRIVDFMGKTAKEIFKDRSQVLADFSRCFSEKRMVKREAPYQLVTTGETRYFVTTYNFIPPNLVIVYIDDITEQRRTEEALRASEEQLELICHFAPDITLTSVNAAYCWYFNQDCEELIGRFMPFVLDKDVEKVKKHFASLNQENPVGNIELRLVKPDGTIRWQRWLNRAIFDNQGHLLEYRSVGRDITRGKQAK